MYKISGFTGLLNIFLYTQKRCGGVPDGKFGRLPDFPVHYSNFSRSKSFRRSAKIVFLHRRISRLPHVKIQFLHSGTAVKPYPGETFRSAEFRFFRARNLLQLSTATAWRTCYKILYLFLEKPKLDQYIKT